MWMDGLSLFWDIHLAVCGRKGQWRSAVQCCIFQQGNWQGWVGILLKYLNFWNWCIFAYFSTNVMDYDNFDQILKLRINFTSFAILRGYFANFTSFSNQYNIIVLVIKWLYFFLLVFFSNFVRKSIKAEQNLVYRCFFFLCCFWGVFW